MPVALVLVKQLSRELSCAFHESPPPASTFAAGRHGYNRSASRVAALYKFLIDFGGSRSAFFWLW
jgi:hypothetical protein